MQLFLEFSLWDKWQKRIYKFCKSNNIQITEDLCIKLVLPFTYGIPNYINHILTTSDEIDIYNNFSEKVNHVLPIEIINIYGNSGIESIN